MKEITSMGEDEELERHGDLVKNIGPQVHGQGEGGVRSLKQGDCNRSMLFQRPADTGSLY